MVEEVIEFLEHLDARLVRVYELLALVVRYLLELVFDVLEQVLEAACFGGEGFECLWAIATFGLVSSALAGMLEACTYSSCRREWPAQSA